MKKSISLETIIVNYKEKPDVDTLQDLFGAFEVLGSTIYDHFIKGNKVSQEIFKSKSNVVRELLCVAFLKMEKYDPTKGKAFNFFTTIMLGWLRQVYRAKKDYAKLKIEYYEKKNRNS